VCSGVEGATHAGRVTGRVVCGDPSDARAGIRTARSNASTVWGVDPVQMRARERFLLAFPAGRSAICGCNSLVKLAASAPIEWAALRILMLDGYVERQSDGAMHHVSQSDPHSACFYSASRNIVEPINAVLGSEVLRKEDVLAPDPGDPESIESVINDYGGLRMCILASGSSERRREFITSERTHISARLRTSRRMAPLSAWIRCLRRPEQYSFSWVRKRRRPTGGLDL